MGGRRLRRRSRRRPSRPGYAVARTMHELKYHDVREENKNLSYSATWAVASVNAIPTAEVCNGIKQGNTSSERTGNKIWMKSLDVVFTIKMDGFTTNGATPTDVIGNIPPQKMEIIVFIDNASNGSSLPEGNFLLDTTGSDLGNNICLFRNMLYTTRFKVLRRFVVDLDPNWEICVDKAGTGYDVSGRPMQWIVKDRINLKWLQTNFNSSSTPTKFGDIADNSILIYANIINSDAAYRPVTLDTWTRLRFTDG